MSLSILAKKMENTRIAKTGNKKPLTIVRYLGLVIRMETLRQSKSKDRSKYLDDLGDGANDDGEKNRWVSAMPDFIFTRMFYVIFKICRSLCISGPHYLDSDVKCHCSDPRPDHDSAFSSSPIHVLRTKDARFDLLSLESHVWWASFPAITSLLTLLVFYIENDRKHCHDWWFWWHP